MPKETLLRVRVHRSDSCGLRAYVRSSFSGSFTSNSAAGPSASLSRSFLGGLLLSRRLPPVCLGLGLDRSSDQRHADELCIDRYKLSWKSWTSIRSSAAMAGRATDITQQREWCNVTRTSVRLTYTKGLSASAALHKQGGPVCLAGCSLHHDRASHSQRHPTAGRLRFEQCVSAKAARTAKDEQAPSR